MTTIDSIKNHLRTLISSKLALFTVLFTLVSILGRFVVHLPNFTPIGALALFAGFYLPRRYALALPLLAMFVSDMFIGFYNPMIMLAVYGSFGVAVLIGGAIKNHQNIFAIGGATLGSSLLFFIATNFAVWAFSNYYAHTVTGLLYCFTLALPFFKYSLSGDMFWASIFFGTYAYFALRQRASALSPVHATLQSVKIKI